MMAAVLYVALTNPRSNDSSPAFSVCSFKYKSRSGRLHGVSVSRVDQRYVCSRP
jgi:hypothetical protein